MSYSIVPTVATGDSWSAANNNTYMRDNLSDHETRILALAASALAVAKRQGGSLTVWQTQGTTNYTPASPPTIQMGVIRMTFTNEAIKTVVATFPVAFTGKPIVLVGAPDPVSGSFAPFRIHTAILANQVSIEIGAGSNITVTADVPWMAIGV